MALPLSGYPLTIWNAIKATLTYAQANLSVTNPASTQQLTQTIATTLLNGSAAFSAYLFQTGTQTNYSALSQVVALPLELDTATTAFLQNRVAAMQQAILDATALQVSPGLASFLLPKGQPTIPYPGYLEYLLNFSYETPPAGLTVANFAAQAQACATAWTTIATAMQNQGVFFTGTSLNAVQQMGMAAQVTANAVANIVLTSSINLTTAWNTLVVVPTICRAAAIIANDPTSLAAQALAIARYVTLSAIQQLNVLLTSLRSNQVVGQPRLAKVRMNDNLMDIANRELGNFEAWRNIATLNGLVPPYIANVRSPGVAIPGDQLFLPSPNGAAIAQVGTPPSYVNNYLGVDIYLGPLNQDMMAWTGDFQVISGYQNLAFSLGRRLQTALTSLIYHDDFGSRIPPEVGSITDQSIAGVLQAYTTSCLLSDPRVASISSVNVVMQQGTGFQITAVVLPNGLGASEVTVNEVFGPV